MGDVVRDHQPCPCGLSSHGYYYYTDGEHCFRCNKNTVYKNGGPEISDEDRVHYDYYPHRGITAETMKHYGVLTKFVNDQPVEVWFKVTDGVGQIRNFETKRFRWTDKKNTGHLLFGQEAFPPGCSDTITITEGAYDAMSSYQLTGRPAVSIFGASSARKDVANQFQYLNSFDKIKIATDADKPGQEAAAAIAGVFDFNKVLSVSMAEKLKDANGYLENGEGDTYKRLWWNAKRYLPAGVLSTFGEFDAAIDDHDYQEPLASFPWEELESKLLGLRPGEITLLTAQEGIGKTEVIRAVEHHILKTTDLNIGIIHLEENQARTVKGLVGLHFGEPVHLPDSQRSNEDIKRGLRDLVRREDRLHIYSHFGADDPDTIRDLIRFLVVACDCKVVFLDHITMLATGRDDEDERRFLDRLSTQLGALVNELKFHLVLISHINDEGKTRGSRNISKIAANRVDLDRDIIAADERERNTTRLTVSKARFSSLTGPAGELFFDRETFTLVPASQVINEPEDLPT